MRGMPWPARAYVLIVVMAGLGAAVVAFGQVSRSAIVAVAVLIGLILLSEAMSLRLSEGELGGVSISTNTPVLMASYLIVGPWGAVLVGASMLFDPGRLPLVKRTFNAAQVGLAAGAAGLVYVTFGGNVPVSAGDFPRVLVLVGLANLAFEIVNVGLTIGVISLTEKLSPVRLWFGTFRQLVFPLFLYSLFGLMLAVVWCSGVGPFSAILVLAPLFIARWVFAQFAAEREAYESTMRSLIQAVETKDSYTRGHSERVSRGSVLVGRGIGMREDRVATLRYAGMLHDVGKLGVPTTVLQKAGRLTDEEYAAIQMHPIRGREITRDLEFLGEAIEGIYHHHERIDGRGYPLGLKGSEIPEFARVIAVADAFDSMTTTRSYRGARSIEDAVAELRRCKGSQFDPVMVEALVVSIEREGWDVEDTLPDGQIAPTSDVPAFGSDDDDPTALTALGLGGPIGAEPAPDDASELFEPGASA